MIEDTPSRPHDVWPIFFRLSKQHRGEIARSGIGEDDYMAQFIAFADQGTSDTIIVDGFPEAVIAIAHGHTWFMASQGYFEAGPRAIRHARRYMKGAVARRGALLSMTAADHPDLDRWMRAIGAERTERSGSLSYYIFA